MPNRYLIAQKIEVLEKEYNATLADGAEYKPNYNLSIGQLAPVITNLEPKKIQMFCFGMTPFWAEKKMYLYNARTEGDHNQDNLTNYHCEKGIITKPAFRKPIRQQRCLIIADCYFEASSEKGFDEPYLVYLQGRRPFAMAGVWDEWPDKATGETFRSFAIITVPANELIQKIPHKRMPVILSKSAEGKWLRSNAPLSSVTSYLSSYPAEKMNAYPITPAIKDTQNNGREFIEPLGPRLQPEEVIKMVKKEGFYSMRQKS
jgi:putative SOS response-associated peptidase YedK